ncbi:acyltransferase [Arcicella sp. LKC2W]|uniref:acyltransferase family protein n=1 Tax=Arcicella sp. LKC2W TaxID=2984198 RepID=UPI002B1F245D|nr:acyltransferase [Arcicella sp. LKC2W]MEA5458971.1 acyltransferase [Arcicella sp. LKC2W]
MNGKIELLQVYRGFAALLVVLHHIASSCEFYLKFMPFNDFFKIGWSGVDFFFVLSGFIITFKHYQDIGHPESLLGYFKKRFYRIYPTYWVVSSFALFLMLISGMKIVHEELLTIPFILKSYLLIPTTYPFLGVAWSLCYEVFFYVIFGFLVYYGNKLILPLIAFYVIFLFTVLFLNINNEVILFLGSPYHIEFLFGCTIAYINIKYKPSYNKLFFLFGLLLFSLGYFLCFKEIILKTSIFARFFFGISSSLIIDQSLKIKTIYSFKKLLSLGNASFSLYLIHPIIIPIFFKSVAKLDLIYSNFYIYTIIVLCITSCYFISLKYYEYIEEPLVKSLQTNRI